MSAFKFKGKDGQDVIMDYSELLQLKGKDAESYLLRKLKSGEASPLQQQYNIPKAEKDETGNIIFKTPQQEEEIKKEEPQVDATVEKEPMASTSEDTSSELQNIDLPEVKIEEKSARRNFIQRAVDNIKSGLENFNRGKDRAWRNKDNAIVPEEDQQRLNTEDAFVNNQQYINNETESRLAPITGDTPELNLSTAKFLFEGETENTKQYLQEAFPDFKFEIASDQVPYNEELEGFTSHMYQGVKDATTGLVTRRTQGLKITAKNGNSIFIETNTGLDQAGGFSELDLGLDMANLTSQKKLVEFIFNNKGKDFSDYKIEVDSGADAVENMIEFNISEGTKRKIDEEVDAISFDWSSRGVYDNPFTEKIEQGVRYSPGEYEQIVNQQIQNLVKIGGYSEEEVKSATGNVENYVAPIQNELRIKAEQAAKLVIKRQKEIAIRKGVLEKAIEQVRKGDELTATLVESDLVLFEGTQNNFTKSRIKISDTRGELLLDAELLKDKEVNKWIDIEAEIESITQALDDSFVGQMLDKFKDAIGDPDYEFDTEVEAETFALSILLFQQAVKEVEALREKQAEIASRIENIDIVSALLSKNYDSFDKFFAGLQYSFGRQARNISFGLTKMLGIDNKDLQANIRRFNKEYQEVMSGFKSDVSVKEALSSVGGFMNFFAQETVNQLPTFITMMIPKVGVYLMGIGSFGDKMYELTESNELGQTNFTKAGMYVRAAGFATADFLSAKLVTIPILSSISKRQGLITQTFKKKGTDPLKLKLIVENGVALPAAEVASELFAISTQNAIDGKPITSHWDHVALSSFLFGASFNWSPLVYGSTLATIAPDKSSAKVQGLIKDVADLQDLIDKTTDASLKQGYKQRQLEIQEEIDVEIENIEDKIKQMNPTAKDILLGLVNKIESKKIEVRKVNDSDLSFSEKTEQIGKLLKEIQNLENFRTAMFSDDINLAAFNVAIKNGDKDAKDALAKANNLFSGKDTKVIKKEATRIFNEVKTKQVCDSVYGVGSDSTIDTVEEAVDVIELMGEEGVLSRADVKVAIKGIKNGNHGFYINGKPYTVVENAAKDERFENATHERGHKMLADAILSKEGRAKLRSIAKVILEFAQKNDPVLYTRLVAEVSPYLNKQVSADNASDFIDNISDENIDEPIVVFLENFDRIKGSLESGLASQLMEVLTAKGGALEGYNINSAESAIKFFETLSAAIKNGDINFEAESKAAKDVARELLESTVSPDPRTLTGGESAIKNSLSFDGYEYDEDFDNVSEGDFVYDTKDDEVNPDDDRSLFDETIVGETNESWRRGGFERSFNKIFPLIGKYIKSKLAKYTNIPNFDYEEAYLQAFSEITVHLQNFKPEDNDSLYGWFTSTLRFEVYDGVLKTVKADPELTAVNVDDVQLGDAEITEDSTEAMLDAAANNDITFGDLIFTMHGIDKADFDADMKRMLKPVIIVAAKNYGVGTDAFFNDVKKSGEQIFVGLLKDILGSPGKAVYQSLLSNYGEQIYDMIPQEVMNKRMQDFIVKLVDRANKEQMEKLSAATSASIKPGDGAGNAIFGKKEYVEQEFIDFFLKPKKGRPASKQTTLLEIISFEMTKDLTMELMADPDFVQENKDYLKAVNLGEVALQLQRDQNVKWSRTWRLMSQDDRAIIISVMPQLQTGLFNATSEDDYIKVITEGLEGRISKTKLKNFAKDLFKKINPDIIVRKDKSPTDIGNITVEYLTESEQVLEYAKEMLKGTDYKSFTEAFDDSNFINDGIRATITAIQAELKFNNGDKAKTLYTILKWYTGHLAGNTNIGRGDHVRVGDSVFVIKDNDLTYKDDGSKRTMRDQILENKQHLVDVCKVALGLSDAEIEAMIARDGTGIKGVIVDGKELSTKILKQDVEAGQKRTYEESQEEANEGWDVLMRLLDSYKKQGSNAQFGALMVSLKSNMSTLLKAIAPVQYKSLDKVVKNATHRYEHMLPAMEVVVSLTDFVLNEDSDIDLDQLKEDFKVAIISKDFDKLVNIFYQYTLPKSKKVLERYYNIRSKGHKDVQSLLNEKTGETIGEEFTQGDIETVMIKDSRVTHKILTNGDFVYNTDSGASLFDMDDTLRFGDEKTWFVKPNPKNDPKPNFKAIYVVGANETTNSDIIKQLGLENKGFVVVKTEAELSQAIKEGKGVVIDGSKDDLSKINNRFETIANNGYQQSVIFLENENTPKKVKQQIEDYKILFGEKFFSFAGDNITKKFKSAIERFTNGIEVGKLDAEQFASEGKNLLDQGAKFNFAEFGTVEGGDLGPAFAKLKEKYDKYGSDNIYIVTARPKVAAEPIQKWLEAQGIILPLENIRCLENSTAEAKASETLKIINEKNLTDVLFDDDAPQNVQAVKDLLEDIGIDFNMYQAGVKWSKTLSDQFRQILARTADLDPNREISDAEARMRGRTAQSFFDKFYIPPSAEDFMGLMYKFMGKGEDGNKDHEFFLNNLSRVYGDAIQKQDFERQKLSEDYSSLKKENKEAVKILKKKVPGFVINYTYDHAIRTWIWQRMGLKAEDLGLSQREFAKLTNAVGKDPKLVKFASELMAISQQEDGYIKPTNYWISETISSDLDRIIREKGKGHLDEFKANRAAIFGDWQGGKLVGQNMNVIRATYGDNFVEALEDMLWRMENGTNRSHGGSRIVNRFMNWTNNSVGAIMFFNMRSAVLQTMSAVNYINWSDNNMVKAAAAFANQKQFWQDFAMLFNSDWLKQRRAGLKINVNAAELQQQLAAYGAENKAKGAFQYLIKIGFTPTQIADSFAIASGGATFYRNRVKTYVKDGMDLVDAEAQALKDTREIAEKTQQSARADLISQQQASGLGRIILAFANTPMQYARETKKAVLDLANGRGDTATNISKIIYYGAVQNIVFGALQSAYFAVLMGESDDEETDLTEKQIEKRDEENKTKINRILNSALDSQLRGMGVTGSVASTIKNTIIRYVEEEGKGWNMQRDMVLIEALKISPPISSKVRKLNTAMKSWSYNEATIDEMNLSDPNNPLWEVIGNVVSAVSNIPVDRVVSKIQNTNAAISQDLQAWQRLALVMGWNTWDLDVELESKVEARKIADQKKKERKEAEKQAKKEEEKRLKEEAAEAERKRKEAEGIKQVQCSQIKKNGERCKMIVETKNKTAKCVYHK